MRRQADRPILSLPGARDIFPVRSSIPFLTQALGDVTIRVEICTGGKCKETKVPTSGSMSVKDVVKSEYYKNLRKEKNIRFLCYTFYTIMIQGFF